MPSVRLNEPYRLSLEKRATELATAFSGGELGVTECVRGLVPILRELGLDGEKPLSLLIGFDSELDGLPVGAVREHWDKAALRREDKQRLQYEQLIRNEVSECCRSILSKFRIDSE